LGQRFDAQVCVEWLLENMGRMGSMTAPPEEDNEDFSDGV
jgi:hypothetical protein